ncbi:MAG: nuclear transport factor 2 family protein [Polyangiaceae bacterium]
MSESNLRDHESIRNLKSVYARRADAVFQNPGKETATAMADLFADDALLDLGPFGRYEGRAALLHAFENVLPAATGWAIHYMMNPVIEVNGDSATGAWYFLIFAQARQTPPPPGMTLHGGYDDKYVRVRGEWKIARSVAWFTAPAQ